MTDQPFEELSEEPGRESGRAPEPQKEDGRTGEQEYEYEKITYTKGRKLWLELKDILTGVAFPLIITVIFSSTVIAFADVGNKDMAITLLALIGGEGLLFAAIIVFGRANGAHAYKATLLQAQKRALNSSDERAVYKTGEYALWKSAVISAIACVPFAIFQTVQLIAPNTFTSFCLKYICGWAYYPFSLLGEAYQGLNYLFIPVLTGLHTLGYYLGKLKVIRSGEFEEDGKNQGKGRKKK